MLQHPFLSLGARCRELEERLLAALNNSVNGPLENAGRSSLNHYPEIYGAILRLRSFLGLHGFLGVLCEINRTFTYSRRPATLM